jgi:hypothetical protein
MAMAERTEWFSEHLLNPARRVTQVAIHRASALANSDILRMSDNQKRT